jgi:hypothetical protein
MWTSQTSEMVTAVATVILTVATVGLVFATVLLAVAALRQLRDARAADLAATERHREMLADQHHRQIAVETLRVCSRVDIDPVLTECLRRIWHASDHGKLYVRGGPVALDDVWLFANYLDGVATGVLQGLFSNDIAKDHLGVFVRRFVEVILPTVSDLDGYDALVAVHASWFPRLANVTYTAKT